MSDSSPPPQADHDTSHDLDAETEFVSKKAKYNRKEMGTDASPATDAASPTMAERGSSPFAQSIEADDNDETGQTNVNNDSLVTVVSESTVGSESNLDRKKSNLRSPTSASDTSSPKPKKSVKLMVEEPNAEDDAASEKSVEDKKSKVPATMKSKFFKHSLPEITPNSEENTSGYYVDLFDRHESAVSVREAETFCSEIAACSAEIYNDKLSERKNYDKKAFGDNESFQSLLDGSKFFGVWEERKNLVKTFSSAVFKRGLSVAAAHLRHNSVQEVSGFLRRSPTSNTYLCREEGLMIHIWQSQAEGRKFNTCFQRLWQMLFENAIGCIHTCASALVTYRGCLVTIVKCVPISSTEKIAPSSIMAPILHHFSERLTTALGSALPLSFYPGGDGRYYLISTLGICPHEFESRYSSDASTSARLEVYHLIPPLATKREVGEFIQEDCIPEAAEALLERLKQTDSTTFIRQNDTAKVLHENGVNLRFLYKVYTADSISAGTGSHPKASIAAEILLAEMAIRALKEAMRGELVSTKDPEELMAVHRLNRLLQSCLSNKKTGVWNQVVEIARTKFDTPMDFAIPLSPSLIKHITARLGKLGCTFDQASGSFTKFQGMTINFCFFGLPDAVKESVTAKAAAAADDSKSEDGEGNESSMEGSPAASPLRRRRSSFSNMSFSNLNSLRMNDSFLAQPENEATEDEAAVGLTRKQTFFQRQRNAKASEIKEQAVRHVDRDKSVEVQDLIRTARTCFMLNAHDEVKSMVEELMKRTEEVKEDNAAFAALTGIISDIGPEGFRAAGELHHERLQLLHSQHDSLYVCMRLRNYADMTANLSGKAPFDTVRRCITLAKRIPAVDMSFHWWFQRMICDTCLKLGVVDYASDINEMLSYTSRLCGVDDSRKTHFIISFRKISNSLIAAQNQTACQQLKPMEAISLKLHEEKFGEKDVQTGVAVAHSVYVAGCALERKLPPQEIRELKRFHQITNSFGTMTVGKLQETLSTSSFLASLGSMTQILAQHGEKAIAARAMHHSLIFTGDAQPVASVKRSVEFLKEKAHSMITAVVRMKLRPVKHGTVRVESDEYHHRVGTECVEEWDYAKIQCQEMEALELIYRKAIKELEVSVRAKISDVCWRDRYEVRRKDRIKEKEEEMETRKQSKMREAREAVERLKKREEAQQQKDDRENLELITAEQEKQAALVKAEEEEKRQRELDAERERKRLEREDFLKNEENRRRAQEEEEKRKAAERAERERVEAEKRAAAKALLEKKMREEEQEKQRREAARKLDGQIRNCIQEGQMKNAISSEEAIERRAIGKLAEKNKSDIKRRLHKQKLAAQMEKERAMGAIPVQELNAFLAEEDTDPLRKLQKVETSERQQLFAVERMRFKALKQRAKDLLKMTRTLDEVDKDVGNNPDDVKAARRRAVLTRMKEREERRVKEAEEAEKAREEARTIREAKREELAQRPPIYNDPKMTSPRQDGDQAASARGDKYKTVADPAKQADERRKKLEQAQKERQAQKEADEMALMKAKATVEKLQSEKPKRLKDESLLTGKPPVAGNKSANKGPALHALANAKPTIDPETNKVTNDALLQKVHENKRECILARMEERRQQRAKEAIASEKAGWTAKEWTKQRDKQHDKVVASIERRGRNMLLDNASQRRAHASNSSRSPSETSPTPKRQAAPQQPRSTPSPIKNDNTKKPAPHTALLRKPLPLINSPAMSKYNREMAKMNPRHDSPERIKAERRAEIKLRMAARVKTKADLMVAVEKNKSEAGVWKRQAPRPYSAVQDEDEYEQLLRAEVDARGPLPPLPQRAPVSKRDKKSDPQANPQVESLRKNIVQMFSHQQQQGGSGRSGRHSALL